MNFRTILIASLIFFTAGWEVRGAAIRTTTSIRDIMQANHPKSKYVIRCTVTRAFDLDTFLVKDESGEITASFVNVRQNLKVDDTVVIYGRFMGRFEYLAKYGVIQVIRWAKSDEFQATSLIDKYGATPLATPAPVKSEASPTTPDIETRLKELDELKTKNMLTPEEYQEQRHRILNGL